MREDSTADKKSLRVIPLDAKKISWRNLAGDCVAFANANGGSLFIGVEDESDEPDSGQRVPGGLVGKVYRGITSHTDGVNLVVEKRTATNGGEYLEVIVARSEGIAGTTDGTYFIRVDDVSKRLSPAELTRLLTDRPSFVWEHHSTNSIPESSIDEQKLIGFLTSIRNSDRVKPFVAEKSDREILEHYFLVKAGFLTNLGVLWIGKREDRARLSHAPVVQCIRFDDRDEKVFKRVWDDFSLNPLELIDEIWRSIPDWRQTTEVPEGIFRRDIPHYDEAVVRELLANALVHRPYTVQGDIFINIYPDRVEIHNPGTLPIGVTPQNIIHATVRRNPHLAQIFHDLHLMEREGSGIDQVYDTQLSSGKAPPVIAEGADRVVVSVSRRIINREVINLVEKARRDHGLSQRERITLGLLAQEKRIPATKLSTLLDLRSDADRVRTWVGRLVDFGLVTISGTKKAAVYQISDEALRNSGFQGTATLTRITNERLRALIEELLRTYAASEQEALSREEIRRRVGTEIPPERVSEALIDMKSSGKIAATGVRRGMKYFWRS